MEPKKLGKIQVLKFGGTSVKDIESMKLCAEHVAKHLLRGPVVVVVSATAGTTDKLIQEVSSFQELGIKLSKAATDMIITTGENISASVFSGVLGSIGVESLPVCSWQLPILMANSSITDVKVGYLHSLIEAGIVPVITGFQGIENNILTSLDRGGSDVSAVCIAKYLGLDTCYIYTDVPGIYRFSPKLALDRNEVMQYVNYADAYSLAANGAKVIHKDAVKFGEESGMKLIILSTFDPGGLQSTQINTNSPKQYGVTSKETVDGLLVYVLHNNLISTQKLESLNIVSQTDVDLHILFRRGEEPLFSLTNQSVACSFK